MWKGEEKREGKGLKKKRWKRGKKGKTMEKYAYTMKNECSI